MEKIGVIVLAAGLGQRLGGDLPKVLHSSSEQTLLSHVLDQVVALSPERCVVVTGHKRELVEAEVLSRYPSAPMRFAFQAEQRGTGHAVRCAQEQFKDFSGTIVILYGDTPLIRESTLKRLLALHYEKRATVSVVTALLDDPASYGRVIRGSKSNTIEAIREAKDCSAEEYLIREILQGSYAVDSSFLWPAVERLKDGNSQKELYLTDIVSDAAREGQTVVGFPLHDSEEALGVNDHLDLQRVNSALNRRRIETFQRAGVQITQPESVFVEPGVSIAAGVVIGPQVQIRGRTVIESGVLVDGVTTICDCIIRQGAHIKLGVVAEGSEIGPDASIGPFAHLRSGTVLGANVKIGNFVETKKAVLGADAKASHLSYLGDCIVGESANIGAGTITCNYDGYRKATTQIGKGAFIGSNSSLVAPVTIDDHATVGAGSVITKNVSKDALAVTRAPQTETANWSKRKREQAAKRSK